MLSNKKVYFKDILGTFFLKGSYDLIFLKCFEGISYPFISEIFLFLGLTLVWYENLFARYNAVFHSAWIVPLFLILSLFFADKKKIKLGNVQLWYLVFLFFSALSGLFALLGVIGRNMLVPGFVIFAQFFVVILISQGLRDKKRFINKVFLLAIPIVVLAILQFILGVETPKEWTTVVEESVKTRAFGFFDSPNVLGAVFAILGLSGFVLALRDKGKVYFFFAFLSSFVLFATYSRSAWLAFGGGLVALLFVFRKQWLYYLPFSSLLFFIPQVKNRILVVFSFNYLNDAYLDGRIWSFYNSVFILKKHLSLGTGPGTYGGLTALKNASPIYLESMQNGYTALYFTDNQWIEILVQTGVLGFLSFLGFIFSVILNSINNFKESNDIIYLVPLSTIIMMVVMGCFANVLEFGAVSFPLAIFIGSFLNYEKSSDTL